MHEISTSDKGDETDDGSSLATLRAGWRTWREVPIAAADRAGWPQSVKALCATWHEVDS